MNNLEVVYWDVDGTIADTEMFGHRIAFNKAFLQAGLGWDWDIATYKRLLEISGGFHRIKYFSEKLNFSMSNDEITQLHLSKQKFYKEIINSGLIPPREGVVRLMNELAENNIKQWIVTTSSKLAVDALCKSILRTLNDYIEGCITSEDVNNTKPDPEAYNKASLRTKINKKNSIAIEDSVIGLQSAKAAGLNCLITYCPWNHISLNDYNKADAIVDMLGDENSKCSLLRGPSIPSNIVDLEYLKTLIN
tara:strand:+ start:2376 stop:3122 length:747 start_codon:yes stop_codon:yes gene_type:complete